MDDITYRLSRREVFISNKVHEIAPKRDMKAIDVTSAVDTTMRLFLLDRLVPHPNGEFSFKNIRVKSFLAALILFICSAFCIVDRWFLYDNPVYFFIDLLSGLIWITQCIVSLAFACLQRKEKLQAYNDTLQDIDDRLQFKQNLHKKDRIRCNLIFFGTISVQFVTLTTEMIVYKDSWSSQFTYSLSVSYYVARLVVSMTVLDYLTKLQMYRSRLAMFQEKCVSVCEVENPLGTRVISRMDWKNVTGQKRGPVMLISCYRLLSALCHIINERFGFKIVMLYTNVTITSVLATYGAITSRNVHEQYDNNMFVALIFMLDVMEVNLVAVWIIEYVMSIERHFRGILLTLENIIATDTSDNFCIGMERPRDRWRELLALCRRRPVEFTACGFFPLNYSLLAGLLAAMVTYTIMLVQSNKQSK